MSSHHQIHRSCSARACNCGKKPLRTGTRVSAAKCSNRSRAFLLEKFCALGVARRADARTPPWLWSYSSAPACFRHALRQKEQRAASGQLMLRCCLYHAPAQGAGPWPLAGRRPCRALVCLPAQRLGSAQVGGLAAPSGVAAVAAQAAAPPSGHMEPQSCACLH